MHKSPNITQLGMRSFMRHSDAKPAWKIRLRAPEAEHIMRKKPEFYGNLPFYMRAKKKQGQPAPRPDAKGLARAGIANYRSGEFGKAADNFKDALALGFGTYKLWNFARGMFRLCEHLAQTGQEERHPNVNPALEKRADAMKRA